MRERLAHLWSKLQRVIHNDRVPQSKCITQLLRQANVEPCGHPDLDPYDAFRARLLEDSCETLNRLTPNSAAISPLDRPSRKKRRAILAARTNSAGASLTGPAMNRHLSGHKSVVHGQRRTAL